MSFKDWIVPRRTALLVVDMQKDFAVLPQMQTALANASRLVEAARGAGAACIFTAVRTKAQTDSPIWRERLMRRGEDGAREVEICREGTPGAEFCGPRPRADEPVIAKRGYSAFSGTALEAMLRAREIDTLVLCGLTTECCVEATAREAFERDFDIFVVTDACAGSDAELHRGALAVLDRHYAILVEAAEVAAAWLSL